MKPLKILIDMDGVVVDFDRYCIDTDLTPDEVKRWAGAYREMEPMPGAIDGVRALIAAGHDVWLATKPPTGQPRAYADKVAWVMDNLPELTRKIILTADKGMLRGDVLIDDQPWKANCESFEGVVIKFDPTLAGWPWILAVYTPAVANG